MAPPIQATTQVKSVLQQKVLDLFLFPSPLLFFWPPCASEMTEITAADHKKGCWKGTSYPQDQRMPPQEVGQWQSVPDWIPHVASNLVLTQISPSSSKMKEKRVWEKCLPPYGLLASSIKPAFFLLKLASQVLLSLCSKFPKSSSGTFSGSQGVNWYGTDIYLKVAISFDLSNFNHWVII